MITEATLEEILNRVLPSGMVRNVIKRHNKFMGMDELRIWVACSNQDINQVQGQKPQIVSLLLTLDTLELETIGFLGNSGNLIYRQINPLDPSEKYLAMKGVKVPFRKPKATEESVLKAVEKFFTLYVETLKEYKDRLRYKDMVNYELLLNS